MKIYFQNNQSKASRYIKKEKKQSCKRKNVGFPTHDLTLKIEHLKLDTRYLWVVQ